MGYAISLRTISAVSGAVGASVLNITKREYLANKAYYDKLNSFILLVDDNTQIDSKDVFYNNTTSKLESDTVQNAIDEVANKMTANGDIVGFDVVRNDGVYITYKDGTNTVRKKLV